MHRFLFLVLSIGLLSAQPVTQTCEDGRVLAITPFNPDPCASSAPAPATTQTCEDGRVIAVTPFNPNPCGLTAEVEETAIPDDFLVVFGGKPAATGLPVEDRLATDTYDKRYEQFVGLIPEPDAFLRVADFYSRWGLGDPTFFRDRNGDQVRWPDAPFHAAEASLSDALNDFNAVVATWQTQAVLRGGVFPELHPSVPSAVRALNQEMQEESQAPWLESGPRLLTFGASRAAAAIHESSPMLVGASGSLRGAKAAPAKAGEFIRLFATGLEEGQSLEASVGGRTVAAEDFSYARMSPVRGGLYVLALRVPEGAGSGDLLVVLTADGVSSRSGPTIAVAR